MSYGYYMIIGMKNKERKYKSIILKLLNKQKLSDNEISFLKREGLLE